MIYLAGLVFGVREGISGRYPVREMNCPFQDFACSEPY